MSRKGELLESIRMSMGECRLCKLHATRSTIVFGEGNPDARVMLIGEG
ncbi:MAG TPA: uracil-DNA glycosylase, partial [Spirochaetota bacterium]|nr:uracil-DNA glycosylase [Spirochaetota bacterium]